MSEHKEFVVIMFYVIYIYIFFRTLFTKAQTKKQGKTTLKFSLNIYHNNTIKDLFHMYQ